MKIRDFILAILITSIWGVNFSVIKLGLLGSFIIFNEEIGLIKILASIFIIFALIINSFGEKIYLKLYKEK